jgi:hypothetical protein
VRIGRGERTASASSSALAPDLSGAMGRKRLRRSRGAVRASASVLRLVPIGKLYAVEDLPLRRGTSLKGAHSDFDPIDVREIERC